MLSHAISYAYTSSGGTPLPTGCKTKYSPSIPPNVGKQLKMSQSMLPFRPLMLFQISAFFLVANFHPLEELRSEQVRLPVSRDTWVSTVGSEGIGNNGGSARLKLKSIQEFSIVDLDVTALRGKRIKEAKLFLKVAGEEKIGRVSISTITTQWNEGTGQSYEVQPKSSSFLFQSYPNQKWADGDLTSVCLGQGGSFWRSLVPRLNGKPVNEKENRTSNPGSNPTDQWIELDVPPIFMEARIAGTSFGFVLMDDLGSEWRREDEKFDFRLFPNRYVYSKDSNRANAPYWIVEVAEAPSSQSIPPVKDLAILDQQSVVRERNERPRVKHDTSTAGMLNGEYDQRMVMQWELDEGHDDIVGFEVQCDGKSIPSYFIPHCIIPNHLEPFVVRRAPRLEMVLDPFFPAWDLNQSHEIQVIALDGLGNKSSPASVRYVPPTQKAKRPPVPIDLTALAIAKAEATEEQSSLWNEAVSWGSKRIAIVDPLDKFVSTSGEPIPAMRVGYLKQNAIWDAGTKRIKLHGGPGHWISFQIAIKGTEANGEIVCSFEMLPEAILEIGQLQGISTEWKSSTGETRKEMIPDAVRPLAASKGKAKCKFKSFESANVCSVLVEAWIPKTTQPGKYAGILQLTDGNASMEIQLDVEVHAFAMPDKLSFYPEMNCYDLPLNDLDYYRLAQRHRVVLNRVPYYQNGRVNEAFVPKWDGDRFESWKEWDKRWEGLLTGKLFEDSPRGPTPIECFYLPFHENWPASIAENYNESYWAEEAFTKEYRRQWVSALKQWNEHLIERGWTQPLYHVYLNNKVDFKKRGWSRGSSPWLLDEPASFQDYLALRFFGDLLNRARPFGSPSSPIVYRGDISRPQWQRDLFDPVLQYNVCSQQAFRQYRRMVLDRKQKFAHFLMIYGSSNPLHTSNLQAVLWSWDTWCRGADGVLPWQTIGNKQSWEKADELALFYPDPESNEKAPWPSVRLKAYRTGQQDVELLNAVHKNLGAGLSRYEFGEMLLEELKLNSQGRGSGRDVVEDAGWSDYGQISPEQVALWRIHLLEAMDGSATEAR